MEPRNGTAEVLLLTSAALLAGAGAVVWAGAVLAAQLSGHSLDASFGDAVAAAVAFPGALADPRQAWPAAVRDNLPGPGLYWSTTAAVGLAGIGLGGAGLRWWGRSRVGTARRRPLGVDARARFATRADLAPLVVRRPQPGRLILGRCAGRLVATEDAAGRRRRGRRQGDRGAVALVGPSRSGKTTAAISAILEWDGPAVLSSVKADLLGATQGWRSRRGDVRVYDPTATTGVESTSWSPLRGAGSVVGAQRAARTLCDAAPRGGVEGGLDFWLAQAEILLSGLLFVAHQMGKDMAAVAEWVMVQDRPDPAGPGGAHPPRRAPCKRRLRRGGRGH